MSSTQSRRQRRLSRRGRGRPQGSRVRLSSDPQRFALATWLALHETGFGPYTAAYLAAVLIESEGRITIENVEDVLVNVSAELGSRTTTLVRRADRLVRKASESFPRVSDTERGWLGQSAGSIQGLLHFVAENNVAGACRCLGRHTWH